MFEALFIIIIIVVIGIYAALARNRSLAEKWKKKRPKYSKRGAYA